MSDYFAKVPHKLIDAVPEVGTAPLIVYAVLVRSAKGSKECWPSLSTLEKATKLGKRTILRAVNTLTKMDLIERKPRWSEKGGRTSNAYVICDETKVTPQHHNQDGKGDTTAPQPSGVKVPSCHGGSDTTAPVRRSITKKKRKKDTHIASHEFVEQVASEWNAMAKRHDLPTVDEITDGRRRALNARLKSPKWRDNWREGMRKIEESDFCKGGGKDGWVASFNWFIKPEALTKLLEGQYANRPRRNGHAASTVNGSKSDRLNAALERARQRHCRN